MRKTALLLRKGNKLDWRFVFECIIGIVFGFCMDQRILPIGITYLYCVYKKGMANYIGFVLAWVFASYRVGIYQALLLIVTSVLFVCIGKIYDALHYEIKNHIFLWNGIITCILSYILYGDGKQTLTLTVMALVVNYGFIHMANDEEYKISWFVYASVLYMYALYLNEPYILFVELAYVVFSAYYLPIPIYAIILFYFVVLGLNPLYGLYLLFVISNRKHVVFLSLLSWISLLIDFELVHIFFATLCSFMGMISYESKDGFMDYSKVVEREHQLYMEHSFYRQIVHYASVFYNLSQYYKDLNEEQSLMLSHMGEALEYNARLSKQYVYLKREIKVQIKELLNGYHFHLLDCDVKKWDHGLMIHLEMEHLYENEIEEVIVPLLEKISENRLRIRTQYAYPFCKGKYKIVLESEEYPRITTYGNSIHVHEVSGDSFHSFDNDPYTVLMVSDGMGKGVKAQKTSRILIQVMEAMIRSHIPQLECVKMMNLFLRSDIYATLDVLSFDRRNYKAYLSKSASAPTYLLRDDVLYEMNAHSLPIGIVDYVNADIYEIHYQKGDIFIMNSDGVNREEIEKWKQLKRCNLIKNEGIHLMNIIKETKRKDDTTILMAKID